MWCPDCGTQFGKPCKITCVFFSTPNKVGSSSPESKKLKFYVYKRSKLVSVYKYDIEDYEFMERHIELLRREGFEVKFEE